MNGRRLLHCAGLITGILVSLHGPHNARSLHDAVLARLKTELARVGYLVLPRPGWRGVLEGVHGGVGVPVGPPAGRGRKAVEADVYAWVLPSSRRGLDRKIKVN